MEIVDAGSRQSNALPSVNYAEFDKIKRDNAEFTHRHPTTLNLSNAPLGSPTNMYSGPPPPYQFAPSNASTAPGLAGIVSPPEPRRPSEKDEASHNQNHSLPSIQEALSEQPYVPSPSSIPRPPLQTLDTSVPPPSIPAPASIPRSHPTQPPPRTYSSGSASNPPTASTGSREIRIPTLHHIHPPTSPSQAPRSAPPFPRHSQASPRHDQAPSSAGPMPSPYGSQSHPSQYPYPPQPAPVRQSTYSQPSYSSPTYAYPGPSNGPDPPDRPRIDEIRKYVDNYPPGEAYGNSVRRHLDIFDLEASLAGIMDGTARLFHWAEHYRQQTPVRMPRLEECKDMLDRHRLVLQSLTTMEDVLQTQEKSRANQQNHNRGYKNANDYDMEDSNGYADDLKSGGVGEGKKRRGRAAPPGRCHSCNRAETPEWRRGPDGARTLCNACGLHYAKLTRKTKASGGGGSSFRTKSIGPSSP